MEELEKKVGDIDFADAGPENIQSKEAGVAALGGAGTDAPEGVEAEEGTPDRAGSPDAGNTGTDAPEGVEAEEGTPDRAGSPDAGNTGTDAQDDKGAETGTPDRAGSLNPRAVHRCLCMEFEGLIREDEPMNRHTTFRVGGPAELFAAPDETELQSLLAAARRLRVAVTIIGNGSNLLVSDQGIKGLVVEIGQRMGELSFQGNRLRIGAGELLSRAANAAASRGLSGMEFAAGIPGSLGGAVVMNAGAYGGEMKDILREVTVLTPDGHRLVLPAKELQLSYRHSCIPEKGYVVTSAVVELEEKPEHEIRAYMEELRGKRVSKQPLEYASAGSTFKRPEGYFAGKLIEDAGLRGVSVGDAQVSEKHCGFVINRGGAKAADILQLIHLVQERVEKQSGVRLEPEVRLLGFGREAGRER